MSNNRSYSSKSIYWMWANQSSGIMKNSTFLTLAILHAFQFFTSLSLMLIYMTFNFPLILSVLLGSSSVQFFYPSYFKKSFFKKINQKDYKNDQDIRLINNSFE